MKKMPIFAAVGILTALVAVLSGVLVMGVAAAPPGAKNFVAPLDGRHTIPPVDTRGTGLAKFHIDKAGVLHQRLTVANMEDIFVVHIHCAALGTNGQVGIIQFFEFPAVTKNGVLFQNEVPAPTGGCGWTTMEHVIAGLRSGDTYVNVHTTAYQNEEIRGQVRVAGPK